MGQLTKKRDPLLEGKIFEYYAWPAVRRNFPLQDGWKRLEQPTLPSGLRPDNILFNEVSEEAVVVEMKDRVRITASDVRKVRKYMDELGEIIEITSVRGFIPIAWDTEVHPSVRRLARRLDIRFRRLEWRR